MSELLLAMLKLVLGLALICAVFAGSLYLFTWDLVSRL